VIGRLRGKLVVRQPGEVLVDCGGVGYQAFISLATFSSLPPLDGEVRLEVVTVLRENALELFAFATAAERHAFQLLRSVSGIGPRMALSVLSGISVDELAAAIGGGNTQRLTTIPGIGRKTAERILVDLRGKLDVPAPSASPAGRLEEDAVSALLGLGYKRAEAEKAVRKAMDAAGGILEMDAASGNLEELLRAALAQLMRTVAG
jgi:Holliday junction DNA helicase RuvA